MATVYWTMTSADYDRYLDVFDELFDSAQCGDTERHEWAKDALKSIPGFPYHAHPDLDRIVPKVTDLSTRIVTFGGVKR